MERKRAEAREGGGGGLREVGASPISAPLPRLPPPLPRRGGGGGGESDGGGGGGGGRGGGEPPWSGSRQLSEAAATLRAQLQHKTATCNRWEFGERKIHAGASQTPAVGGRHGVHASHKRIGGAGALQVQAALAPAIARILRSQEAPLQDSAAGAARPTAA